MDPEKGAFTYQLRKEKLRQVRLREGRYLLRTNLQEGDPAKLWQLYIQLVAIEQAFKEIKGDLGIRPVHHQLEGRIEAHIFVCFLAYCRCNHPLGSRHRASSRKQVCSADLGNRWVDFEELTHPIPLESAKSG